MNKEQAVALRKPFDKKSIGKLPKAGITLDYVGHAAVTDRLLAVDPEWSWRPLATDEHGLPLLDSKGNLWIEMTVCGVTRIGVGDGKSAKEVIGDAIRNCAMRYGVALDLWSKEELEHIDEAAPNPPGEFHEAPDVGPTTNEPPPEDVPGQEALPVEDPPDDKPAPKKKPAKATAKQVARIGMLATDLGLDRDAKLAGVAATIGHEVTTTKELTPAEASSVIDSMQASLDARGAK